MAEPPPRPVAMQQRGVFSVASDVLDAFKTSPVLLLIVLLNIAFAGAGGYYLLQVEAYRAKDREALAELLHACLTQTVPIDYLTKQPPRWSP